MSSKNVFSKYFQNLENHCQALLCLKDHCHDLLQLEHHSHNLHDLLFHCHNLQQLGDHRQNLNHIGDHYHNKHDFVVNCLSVPRIQLYQPLWPWGQLSQLPAPRRPMAQPLGALLEPPAPMGPLSQPPAPMWTLSWLLDTWTESLTTVRFKKDRRRSCQVFHSV